MSKPGAVFIGQIYDVRTKRDGSGRIQIDFSMDAIDEIQWAQNLALKKNCNFQIAMVPLNNQDTVITSTQEELHDSGEVII